jgi:DNA-binding NarL/FixJ family response regulator
MKKTTTKAVIASDQKLFAEGLQALINSSKTFRALQIFDQEKTLFTYLQQHPIDLFLLDMNFTGADGFLLCRKLRKLFPAMKVVILSAYDGDKTVHQARKVFVDGFFLKDISFHELLDGLKKVMKAPPGSFMTCERLNKMMQSKKIDDTDHKHIHDKLSKREVEIMSMIGKGMKSGEIAKALSISYDTFKTHRRHTLNKLGLRTVAELVKYSMVFLSFVDI